MNVKFLRPLVCRVCALLLAAGMSAASDTPAVAAEPTVTPREAGFLASAQALAEKDPAAAVASLRPHVVPQASAALDFAYAVLLARQERFEEAACALESAVGKWQSFRRAWLLLGRVRMLRGETNAAPQALREALKLGADPAEVYKLLAHCHSRAGQAVAAESACRAALALTPDDDEILSELVRALLSQKRLDAAEPLLAELNARAPSEPRYWLMRAEAALGRGDPDRALVLLECLHRLEMLDHSARLTLGDLYFNKGLYEEAAACYRGDGATNTLEAATGLRCAEALLEANRPELARTLLGNLKTQGTPLSARLAVLRARLAEAEDNAGEAEAKLREALRDDPLNGQALLALARMQQTQGQCAAALLTLERAARADGCERDALLAMARLHADSGDYVRAAVCVERAQSLRFDPEVARYLTQLQQAVLSTER